MNRVSKYLLAMVALLFVGVASGQTSIEQPNLSMPTKIGPAYFGPNAFPVPDMLDGRTSSQLKLELYGDCFLGTTTGNVADDITGDLFAKLTIPLFTPKANLTVWMPIFEYFYTSAPAICIAGPLPRKFPAGQFPAPSPPALCGPWENRNGHPGGG